MSNRKSIPVEVSRQLFEESGYRCAVPGCRETAALDRAYIVPHAETEDDSFENLIILCAVCHRRYDRKEIARSAILNYKQNLAVMNGRYNDFERRLLERFVRSGLSSSVELDHSATVELMVRNLVRDGMLSVTEGRTDMERLANGTMAMVLPFTVTSSDLPRIDNTGAERIGGTDHYALTEAGRQLVARWFGAEPILGEVG
ncbi:hypothetical protein HDC34_001913 [Pseudoclavibacter sp. JAI123]|uniref:HNH endonuclease signature motif containing protein n=1 Tax=Pseudoclavibacter sp. JAI123 TaxID=2723065 RepID=UPI0015CD6C3E|nr:HNH endonuclease signature motif containing protein [Pseudoclavibacter sp. JAI123]NYF13619.1 hypothetical protein [Pseudoclavibacter sp. JAI123]